MTLLSMRSWAASPCTGKANFKRTLGTKKSAIANVRPSNALPECAVAFQNAERAQRGERTGDPVVRLPGSISVDEVEAEVLAADVGFCPSVN